MMKLFGAAVFALACAVSPASAAVIVDTGAPDAAGTAYAFTPTLSYAAQFTLAAPTVLTGVEGYFTDMVRGQTFFVDVAANGDGVRGAVRNGAPGATLFSRQAVSTVGIDQWNWSHGWAGVSDVQWELAPGTYWAVFRMQPDARTAGVLLGVPRPLAHNAFRESSIGYWLEMGGGGMGVRISGDPVATPAVPEPATWAMLIAGFGMVGMALRRRRALATA